MTRNPGSVIESPPQGAGRLDAILDSLAETQRQLAALHAAETRLLHEALGVTRAEPGDTPDPAQPDIPLRSLSAQIGALLRVSDRTIQRRLSDAHILVTRFPRTLRALEDGSISRTHRGDRRGGAPP